MPWYVWTSVGLVLMGTEMFTGSFGVLWFGVGALAAGLIAWLGFSLTAQMGVFGVAGLILLLATRPLVRRFQQGGIATGAAALIGQAAVVIEAIDGHRVGSVKVGSQHWRAAARVPLAAGAQVTIRQIEGVTLLVEPSSNTLREG